MTHVSTRVAGTLGYLAPEYAIGGRLTRKADIYSFGVLLLEIVCGRLNTDRRLPPQQQNLLERTWELYQRKELIELLDTSLNDGSNVNEACKYMKIGLLCTQEIPKFRPVMSTVVMMLTGEITIDDDIQAISKPGLLSEFKTRDESLTTTLSNTDTSESEKLKNSFATVNAETSQATMTFNSIYDRTI